MTILPVRRRPKVAWSSLASLLLIAGCGGDGDGGGTEPIEPQSIAAVGNTTFNGFAGTALAQPLAVRVVGSDGAPYAGVNVSWAVTSGGGSLSATSGSTGADGTTEVTWTLGPEAGANSATATASGLGTVTFTANATFQTLEPTVNISIEGDVDVDRVVIPSGVTVTVTGPTTITSEAEVTIDGTLSGDCHALEIEGGADGDVAGTITNACTTQPNQMGPDLTFTVNGPLTVEGTFISSGTMLVRNTPDISIQDILDAIEAGPAAAPALTTRSIDPCTFDGAQFGPPPGAPPQAPEGEDGADGPSWFGACSGDAVFMGDGMNDGAGPGGEGGPAAGDDGDPQAPAGQGQRGGDGGNGGSENFHTPMGIEYVSWTYDLDDGAPGQPHVVVATNPGQSAIATGGNGGNGGGLNVSAGGGIVIRPGGLRIIAGAGGAGGLADATGADGRDATAEMPAQKGGSATSTGGSGGTTTPGRLRASGSVSGESNIQLIGADAGEGGAAMSTAGKGGDGSKEFKDGAMGGNMFATGGDGGEAVTRSLSGATVGNGGDGGSIHFAGGMGGNGHDFCPETPIEVGGNGGMGGGTVVAAAARAAANAGLFQDMLSRPGTGGDAGPGTTDDGEDGRVFVAEDTGKGGDGGDGLESDPGISGMGGEGGDESGIDTGFDRVDDDPNFQDGDDGPVCNAPPMLTDTEASTMKNTAVTVSVPYADEDGDLAATPGTINNLDPAQGSVDGGSWMAGANSVSFLFTPAPDFVGTATFQVSVNDVRGGLSNVVTVFVTVTNTEPVFNADAEIPGSPLEIQVVRNGSADIPMPFTDGDGDVMTFEYLTAPTNGDVTPSTLPSGTSGPTITYQHNGGGDSDMFSVGADDQSGGTTVGQVNITIIEEAAAWEIIAPTGIEEFHSVGISDCPQVLGQVTIRNNTDEAGSFSIGAGSDHISFGTPGPPYAQQTMGGTIPAGGEVVVTVYFNCLSPNDVDTTVTVMAGNAQGDATVMFPVAVEVLFPGE